MNTCGISDYPIDHGRYLIEASAGTGKTYTITHLVLRLVLTGLPVRRILVTTFSNAAADELKSRILELLNEELFRLLPGSEQEPEGDPSSETGPAGNGGATLQPDLFERPAGDGEQKAEEALSPENRKKRLLLQLAVSSIDEMTVSTIHGFCQKMLGEFALRAGKGFGTELAPDESPYISRLVRAFCRERFYDSDSPAAGNFSRLMQAANFASETVDEVVSGDGIGEEKRRPEQNLYCDAYRYVRDRLQAEKDKDGAMSFNDMIRDLDAALQADNGLAELIRARYQAVFVDEFQDTDQVQYRIFDQCFPKGSPNLFYMIGDPKQAIYGFRGADIYTYLLAKNTADAQFTLTKNFRSSPRMIRAVNLMFSDGELDEGHETPGVFLQKDIPFVSIASGKADGDFPDNPGGTLRLRHYTGTQAVCEAQIREDVIHEVEYLLSADSPLRIPVGPNEPGTPVGGTVENDAPPSPAPVRSRQPRASDIAILVQTNAQAAEFVRLLNGKGIAASACKSGRIYNTNEAQLLLLLLRCFLHPDLPSVRGLMLSPFFRASCDSVASDSAWAEQLMRQTADCGRTWAQSGLPAAFLRFLDTPAFGGDASPRMRILSGSNGERAITNLIQLMELLYRKESEEHFLPDDVFTYLNMLVNGQAEEGGEGGSEDNPDQLRLDRDTASVQVLTMFAAKGLEFPVVFVPYPAKKDWQHMQKNTGEKSETAFRINRAAKDAGSPGIVLDFGLGETNQTTARQEEIRNGLRLLYVALTRASLVTYLYTRQLAPPKPGRKLNSNAINFTCSAQGVLLMSHDRTDPEAEEEASQAGNGEAPTVVERKWDEGYFAGSQDLLPRPLAGWWTAIDETDDADAAFHVRQYDVFERHFGKRRGIGPLRAEDAPETMEAAVFAGEVRDDWSIMSFSAFHNILNNQADVERETPADLDERNDAFDDAAGNEANGETPDTASSDRNIFRDFPHGATVGSMTHKLLELCAGHFDLFRPEKQADPANTETVTNRIAGVLRSFGYDPGDETLQRQLLDGVSRTLQIRLPGPPGGRGGGFALSELEQDRMVPEMEFFLDAPASLDIGCILTILAESASGQARPLVSRQDAVFDKKGILNGIIDLTFEHDGKYYIVDWKTNWLGDSDADYTPDRIRAAMGNAGYILQSCLYAAALLQILRQRGLDYEAFGGVYYLFLRGLKRGTQNGIWFDVPPRECLERLLALFQKGHGT